MKDIFTSSRSPKTRARSARFADHACLAGEDPREWSHGEVKKPETINYRTFKPERDGLFCAKIFGPVKDYECNWWQVQAHEVPVEGRSEKRGVEVIQAKVRRERMGHISLATPVAHIWFLKSLPSRIGGNLLDIPLKDLEKVLYCEAYIVIDPKSSVCRRTSSSPKTATASLLDEMGYDAFEAGMGAEAPRSAKKLDIVGLAETPGAEMREITSEAKRKKIAKAFKVVEAFRAESGNKPEWMMLTIIPVIPLIFGRSFRSTAVGSRRRSQRSLSPRHQP